MTTSSSRSLKTVIRTTYGKTLMCLTIPMLQLFGFLKKKQLENKKYGAFVEWYRQRKTQFLVKILTVSYFMVKNTVKSLLFGEGAELS
jgi:hypothetical protein